MDRETLGLLADTLGVVGFGFATVGWIFALAGWFRTGELRKELQKERQRRNRKIKIVLRNGVDKIEVPVEVRRDELTRAEVLGLIGTLPRTDKALPDKQKRFAIEYVGTADFYKQLRQVIDGESDGTLEIACSPEELTQFEVEIKHN